MEWEKEYRRVREERDKLAEDVRFLQTRRVKIPNIPLFKGDPSDKVEDFIFQVDRHLVFYQVENAEIQLEFLVNHLTKNALTHYRALESMDKELVNSYPKLKEKLREKFTPINEVTRNRSKLYDAKQSRGVDEFIQYFNTLLLRVPDMDATSQLELFIRGLKPELKKLVTLKQPKNLLEAQQVSLDLSHLHRGLPNDQVANLNTMKPKGKNNKKKKKGKENLNNTQTQQGQNNQRGGDNECFICKAKGHTAKKCPSRCPHPKCAQFANHKQADCGHAKRDNAPPRNEYDRLDTITFSGPENDPDDEKYPEPDPSVIHSSIDRLGTNSLLTCNAVLKGTAVRVMFDTGASSSFLNTSLFTKLNLHKSSTARPTVRLANDAELQCDAVTIQDLTFKDPSKFLVSVELRVLPINYDVILGIDFLRKYRSEIRMQDKLIHLYTTKTGRLMSIRLTESKQNDDAGPLLVMLNHSYSVEPKDENLRRLLKEYKTVFSPIGPIEEKSKIPHQIKLTEENPPIPKQPTYRLDPHQLEELRKQLTEMQRNGFIIPSSSQFASPCLFVRKADKSLRLVIDYRAVNQWIVKNNFTIPLIDDLVIQLAKANIYSKIDLQSGYYQIPLATRDRHITAFRSQLGLWEYTVLPMGIRNAVECFQANMFKVFRDHINTFIVVYLDDILVYSQNYQEHLQHLQITFDLLEQHGFKAKESKCSFAMDQITFLGNIISKGTIRPDMEKVKAVYQLAPPKTRKQLQSFLGSTGYYNRFISDYSAKAAPLTSLLKQDQEYTWTPECQKSFETLKYALTDNTVLQLPQFEKQFYLFVDASGLAAGAVLTQLYEKTFKPVYYASHKWNDVEARRGTYELELSALVFGLKQFRMFLQSAYFEIFTDCRALIFILRQKIVSAKLARQLSTISEFHFDIHHIVGTKNLQADMLSRMPISSEYLSNPKNHLEGNEEEEDKLITLKEIKPPIKIPSQTRASLQVIRTQHVTDDKDKQDILRSYHASVTAAHPGVEVTFRNIKQHYHWYGMKGDVTRFIRTCHHCQLNKGTTQKPSGLLLPIRSPNIRWNTISIDFVMPLTKSEGYDAILVIVDKFSKFVIIVPTTTKVTSIGTAKLLMKYVIAYFGVFKHVISDRDVRFTSGVIKELTEQLHIKQLLSSAYHPQTDGQTESSNKIIINCLRYYVNRTTSDWSKYLSVVQLALNSRVHSSTKVSPFYLNFGRLPDTFEINTSRYNMNTIKHEVVRHYLRNISKAIKLASDSLIKAQAKQKHYYDTHHKHVEFSVDDQVLLSSKNLRVNNKGISKKLLSPFIGPFQILHKRGNTYHLDLSTTNLRIHPWFHVSLLKPYYYDPTTINIEDTRRQVELYDNEENHYEVERIMGKQGQKYLVAWKNYPMEENTWVHRKDINAPQAIQDFENNQ